MKKLVIVVGVVVILAVGAILATSALNKSQTQPNFQNPDLTSSGPATDDVGTTSRYLFYNSDALDLAKGNKRVLFFYANWCPTCRPADANFRANLTKIPEDVRIIRVNYNDTETDDEEKTLAEKYQITYQHTYVQINELGEVVKKWNGGALDELLVNVK